MQEVLVMEVSVNSKDTNYTQQGFNLASCRKKMSAIILPLSEQEINGKLHV